MPQTSSSEVYVLPDEKVECLLVVVTAVLQSDSWFGLRGSRSNEILGKAFGLVV